MPSFFLVRQKPTYYKILVHGIQCQPPIMKPVVTYENRKYVRLGDRPSQLNNYDFASY
jgi:hypothetical protein